MKVTRQIAVARQEIGPAISSQLLPLEDLVNRTAVQAAGLVAMMIERHGSAALPPSAGADAIAMIGEASNLILQARDEIGKAHDAMLAIALEYGFSFTEPECPQGHLARPSLRSVA